MRMVLVVRNFFHEDQNAIGIFLRESIPPSRDFWTITLQKPGSASQNCGIVGQWLSIIVFFQYLLTERFFLSSSVPLSFFCLMDSKTSSFVAALTNKDKTFLSYHFFCTCPLRCWGWKRWCDMGILAWFLELNCQRQWWWILVCSTICLFVLHPLLEALVPCRHHFESHCWDLLCHVTHLFLSLSFVVYSRHLLGHCSLLSALWIPCWLYCLCFLFLPFVWTSSGMPAPNVCQCCLNVSASVCRIVFWHLNFVPDCVQRLYTSTEFQFYFNCYYTLQCIFAF